MTKYSVFYMYYSTDACVDSDQPIEMDSEKIGAAFLEHVREQDDFFGVVDGGGVVFNLLE